MRVPFVIYADYEDITEKIDSCTPISEKSYTEKYQKHTPSGFCYYVKCENGENDKEPVVYRGEDCEQKFCEMIEGKLEKFMRLLKTQFLLK